MPTAQNSIRHFHLMEQFKTHRMQDLEVLSKREVELLYPSQCVTYIDRFSAAVCCVVGSCFSLQKEYETALIDSSRCASFTDTHTLSGHEYFANEDFDKSIACYQDAIMADKRKYNAWFNLRAIRHCQEKFDFADNHLQYQSTHIVPF